MKYLLPIILGVLSLEGAPYRYEQPAQPNVHELKDVVDTLRRELSNQTESMRMLEQKTITQDDIIDALQKEIELNREAQKERLKLSQGDLGSLQQEVKSLSDNAKETQDALKGYKTKLASLEKSIEGIQSAMNNLIELQRLSAGLEPDGKTYKVKAGDSLEKIARHNGTTIKALKEANNLTKDQIVIGQTLKLPE